MNIVLIDLSSLAHPLWHVAGKEPDQDFVSQQTVRRVRDIAGSNPHVAVCVDVPGRNFRHEIDPQYKATRPADENRAVLHHQIDLAIEVLKNDGFPVWGAKGFEADDVIATACAMALKIEGAEVLIASADKDLLALVSPRVRVKSTTSGNVLDEDGVAEKLKVLPQQVVDYLSLVGDKSDNVIGAPGIGPVHAQKILGQFGSLDATYRAIANGEAGFTPGGAVSKGLADLQPRLATVRALITMRTDAPIPFDDVLKPRVPKDADLGSFMDDMEDNDMTPDPMEAEILPPKPAEATPPPAPAPQSNGHAIAKAEPQQALVRVPMVFERMLEPQTPEEARLAAKHLFDGRLFSAYGSPAAVYTVIMMGRENGLSATAALRAYHVVEGKPCPSAEYLRALVIRSGKAKYFRPVERTPEKATFITQRRGENGEPDDPPVTLSYSLAEATASGRVKAGSGYTKDPADMCVARASSKLARLVYPDVTLGMHSYEEFEE